MTNSISDRRLTAVRINGGQQSHGGELGIAQPGKRLGRRVDRHERADDVIGGVDGLGALAVVAHVLVVGADEVAGSTSPWRSSPTVEQQRFRSPYS
jgi:hypothetical protein